MGELKVQYVIKQQFRMFSFAVISTDFIMPQNTVIVSVASSLPLVQLKPKDYSIVTDVWNKAHQYLCLLRTCWVHQVTGVWVYPVLERIAPVARVAFFSAMMAVIGVFYVLGEILNSYIWEKPHTGIHTHTHTHIGHLYLVGTSDWHNAFHSHLP